MKRARNEQISEYNRSHNNIPRASKQLQEVLGMGGAKNELENTMRGLLGKEKGSLESEQFERSSSDEDSEPFQENSSSRFDS